MFQFRSRIPKWAVLTGLLLIALNNHPEAQRLGLAVARPVRINSQKACQ